MHKTDNKLNRVSENIPCHIDTIEAIEIGGTQQWIALRSESTSNPIILFLHGGPGTAQIAFSRKAQHTLEKDFIVVNWDQRGAGRSYSSKIKKDDMVIERFVLDAEELVESLLKRFKQKRLFLPSGHSWGSIIGAHLAAKRPDLLCGRMLVSDKLRIWRVENCCLINSQ